MHVNQRGRNCVVEMQGCDLQLRACATPLAATGLGNIVVQGTELQPAELSMTAGAQLFLYFCIEWVIHIDSDGEEKVAAARPLQYIPPLLESLRCA